MLLNLPEEKMQKEKMRVWCHLSESEGSYEKLAACSSVTARGSTSDFQPKDSRSSPCVGVTFDTSCSIPTNPQKAIYTEFPCLFN